MLPVPDCDEEVGVATNCNELGVVVAETDRGVCALCALAQYAVEFKRRILIDIHIGRHTHLPHRKVPLTHTNRHTPNPTPL